MSVYKENKEHNQAEVEMWRWAGHLARNDRRQAKAGIEF